MRWLLFLVVAGCPSSPKAPEVVDTHFACGSSRCDARSEYCERDVNGVAGPEKDTCKPLPSACSNASNCSCFPPETPCSMMKVCEKAKAGDRTGLTLVCPEG